MSETPTPSSITVCCPDPEQSAYSLHPRIYLTLSTSNPIVHCPYCQHEWCYNTALDADER
jgi:uncharacterized Zn-finger protein